MQNATFTSAFIVRKFCFATRVITFGAGIVERMLGLDVIP